MRDAPRLRRAIPVLALVLGMSLAAAAAPFNLKKAVWKVDKQKLVVRGTGPQGDEVEVYDADSGASIGEAHVNSKGQWKVVVRSPDTVPCRVRAELEDDSLERDVKNAPSDCGSGPQAGSHAGRFDVYEGTSTCLACHTDKALQMHDSVHYQWQGDASEAEGLDSPVAGKYGGINDFCIYPDINWIGKLTNVNGELKDGGCAKCHAGLGKKPTPESTQEQLENIDCLLCHSPGYRRTVAMVDGSYRFVPNEAAMGMSIQQAAVDLTLPTNDTCLNCHTRAGGGDNYKRGDIEEAHRDPSKNFDVHMASVDRGGAGLTCLDCHTAENHKIAGRGVDLRPRELEAAVTCEGCHSTNPHGEEKIDKHTGKVQCGVCHIPIFAKVAPTDMVRDWSQPGEIHPTSGLYEPHRLMQAHVTPDYAFFNGRSRFYQFGSAVVPEGDGRVLMAGPVGDVDDPDAKIYPMKKHQGRQPIDPVTGRLLPLKIGIFFQSGDVDTAVQQGTSAVGWTYSGHEFADTKRYMGLYHEVSPKDDALECEDCHEGGNRLDFAALGYTPKETRNGSPLCTSCHEEEESKDFFDLHEKHVKDKHIDCNECHTFSR